MRRVWKRNAKPVLKTEYLWCDAKRNKPQLHHVICEARCEKYTECHDYSEWYFKYYGKEIDKLVIKSKV